jgi:hypothetical protein
LVGWLVALVTSALEDEDSMFVRNVGIDQHINKASKPQNEKNAIMNPPPPTNRWME